MDEPKWHITRQYLRLMRQVSSSNLAAVQIALGYQPQSREDLVTARNFFAHKSESTAKKVRALAPSYRLPASLGPPELLLSIEPGQSQPIVLNWLDDLRTSVGLMS
jgi:hypothetical protein